MKRLLILTLCLLIACTAIPVTAESAPDFPFIEDPFEERDDKALDAPEDDASQNIQISIDGTSKSLTFDPSPEYSSVKDGIIQASFYAFEDDTDTLYELYMIFPEEIESGADVDAGYSIDHNCECSVVLIVSDTENERYYVSGVMNRQLYPEGSSFSMGFDFVESSEFGTSYAGSLSAALIALDLSTGEVLGTMHIDDAPFNFTMGEVTERHSAPLPSSEPSDLRKV